ncbi:hypothetical protein M8C21_006925, partial [Ambrosia artemisiifolia]
MNLFLGFLLFLNLGFVIASIDMVSSISAPESSPMAAAPFAFVPSSMADFTSGPNVGNHRMKASRKLLIGLVTSLLVIMIIIMSIIVLMKCHRRKLHKLKNPGGKRSGQQMKIIADSLRGLALSSFVGKSNGSLKTVNEKASVAVMDYHLLESATGNFGEGEVLGEGGFGCVYRARIDESLCVAVKRLDGGSQDAIKEFQTEIDLLSKIHHPNIITLLGYCVHDDTRLLVYELMHNGSLETQLHVGLGLFSILGRPFAKTNSRRPSNGSNLTWHCRMKIALDTARGLEYLHENCKPSVIHRDLKSSNILLDSSFNAKVGTLDITIICTTLSYLSQSHNNNASHTYFQNFGLAVMDGAQNKSNVKLSGTLGYVAPEYLL